MKRIILAIFAAITLTFGSGLVPAAVYANSIDSGTNEVCKGIRTEANASCGSGAGALAAIFRGVLNILSVIAGLAAVIMIIVAGLKYITSNGDSNAISGAKKTLLYAIIGIIIAVFAQVIVQFVIGKALGK